MKKIWKRRSKFPYRCFSCKKNPVRKQGAFCGSCKRELKNMKNGAF